jgi:hypothetical protein
MGSCLSTKKPAKIIKGDIGTYEQAKDDFHSVKDIQDPVTSRKRKPAVDMVRA